MEDIIKLNNAKTPPSNDDLNRVNMEVASVAHENIKLQEDIRKREETIQNLIYRYAQCEQRVRDFIKHTLRLIYQRKSYFSIIIIYLGQSWISKSLCSRNSWMIQDAPKHSTYKIFHFTFI